MKTFTGYPRMDQRMPHMAPLWGAHPLGDAPLDTSSLEAVPAALVGSAASALNGAVVGGVAARSWMGAGVGAALSAATWAGWTFVGSYPTVGPQTKIALGATAVLSTAALIALLVARSKHK